MAAAMRAVNQPQSWWGWHGWDKPEPMSVVQLMQAGTMPPRLAAAFWLALEHGASFIFAADPPGSGKTTVLSALLVFAPPGMTAYFTKGWGETFELPPQNDGYPTYMMVNEMSDHLPVYSWGPYVVRTFELLAEGYSLLTTVHADTIEEVVDQLVDEVGVAREHVAALTFIVPLAVRHHEGQTLRRVLDIGFLRTGDGAIDVGRVATWNERNDTFSILEQADERAAFAERLGITEDLLERELPRRTAFLERLLADGVAAIDAVEQAVAAYDGDA